MPVGANVQGELSAGKWSCGSFLVRELRHAACSHDHFLNHCILVDNPVIVGQFEVDFYRFPDVRHRLFERVSLAEAAE